MNKVLISLFTSLWLFSAPGFAQVRELPSPAGQSSGQPNLAVSPDGRVYLSWIERLGEGRFSLRFAVKEGDGWSAPRVIAEGSNWFVNWADFPSMVALPDGSLAAHWLVKSGPGTFEYDVNISRSFDGGKTWGKPFVPHRDGFKAEHGFVSMFAAKDGSLAAVWLDGREMKADPNDAHGHGHGNMTLRYVKIKRDGSLADEAALDTRVCECCQTSAAMTAGGPVVVYRDRSEAEKEIRDISVVRLKGEKWSAPRPVFQDDWQLNGCPVNGPAVAAAGRRIAVAWFTGADRTARVKVAFSDDAGETFGQPVAVDDGNPAGRVDVLLLNDGSAMVCWLEKLPEGGAVRVRRVRPDGKLDEAVTVAPSGTARSSGFPQMARAGDTLVFAWTGSRVLTAAMLVQAGSARSQPAQPPTGKVKLLRTPNGGLQPQAALDERGALHLVYFTGEPQGGDLYYVRRDAGKAEFTSPLRVNSEPGSAVAVGTIRGAHLAVGKNGRVHVAWNGRHNPDSHDAPMLYARMNDARTGFDPQINVMQFSGGLDGGGSIAADKSGNVYVAWHGKGDKEGEENRRVWVARSTDEGRTFSRETAAWNEPTGACGCCGMRAFADRQGRVHLFYRAATERVDRDMYLLSSENRGQTFSGTLLDKWKLNACPMSSAALADGANGLLAAWETQGQVYFASLDPKMRQPVSPISAPGATGKRKHPVIAANSRGETMLVWTEGAGWKKGGSLAWQLYDSEGKPVGEKGAEQGIPVWSFAAVVAEKDGSFTIVY